MLDKYTYVFEDETPAIKPLYSNRSSGQQLFGGWSDDGIIKYISLVKANMKARRNKEANKTWENKVLANMRAINDIESNNHTDQVKANGHVTSESDGKDPKLKAFDDLIILDSDIEDAGDLPASV